MNNSSKLMTESQESVTIKQEMVSLKCLDYHIIFTTSETGSIIMQAPTTM